MISKVVLFSNGLTMVFDDQGIQLGELQGHIVDDAERTDKIIALSDSETIFGLGQDLRSPYLPITKEAFEATVHIWRYRMGKEEAEDDD